MPKLYHAPISSCSQKVRLVLAHKEIDFESHIVDLAKGEQHTEAYAAMNPAHVVPTLEDNDSILIESSLINEYLEERYPSVAMLPTDPAERLSARLWVKFIDEYVHPATGVVTYAIGARPGILKLPEAAREQAIEAIPEPARRAARRSVIEHGVYAPEFGAAIRSMFSLLDKMDHTLSTTTWLSGTHFGLADAAALPYVMRLSHLAMHDLVVQRLHVARWLEQVQALPAYQQAVDLWLTPEMVARFEASGEAVRTDVRAQLVA